MDRFEDHDGLGRWSLSRVAKKLGACVSVAGSSPLLVIAECIDPADSSLGGHGKDMSDEQGHASSSRVKLAGFGGGDKEERSISSRADHQVGVKVEDDHSIGKERRRQLGDDGEEQQGDAGYEEEDSHCLICLGEIQDRCVLPKCLHSLFCFGCILKWISIHRRCPLCSISVDEYVIHSIVNDDDYIRHYLPKVLDGDGEGTYPPAAPAPAPAAALEEEEEGSRVGGASRMNNNSNNNNRRPPRPSSSNAGSEWGRDRTQERQKDAIANWDRRLSFRKEVYREGLYALHVGSNKTSKLHSPASSATVASSKHLESIILSFIRRELLAYPLLGGGTGGTGGGLLDVDFLSRYIINVFKTFDCRSNEAIDLIAEFLLDDLEGAQHFCHEVYTFYRFIGDGGVQSASGRQKDKVKAFDEWVQYPTMTNTRRGRKRKTHREEKEKAAGEASHRGGQSQPSLHRDEERESSNIREEVKRGRENLLQRLEQERNQNLTASTSRETDADADPDPDSSREQTLRDKLLLHRREALLKKKAMEHRSKKRIAA